jgi:hypothetical protein
VVIAVLALTGGLADAGARLGPERTPGAVMNGARWQLALHSAVVTQPRYDEHTEVILTADTTNVTKQSLSFLTQGVIVVVLPDGSTHSEVYIRDPGNGFGNPGVTAPVEIEVTLPTQPPGDLPLRVVVRDERDVGSFVSAERWAPTAVIGHIPLLAEDVR